MNINRLQEIRKEKNYKQNEIAKILNVTQAQYSRYETGENTIPLDKIYKLAEFYKTSIDYLVYRTEERKIYPKTQAKE